MNYNILSLFFHFFRSNYKVIPCSDSNAATHSGGTTKQSVVLTWTAPHVTSSTTVKFVFTVVQSISTFWVKREAESQVIIEPETMSSTAIKFPSTDDNTSPTSSSSASPKPSEPYPEPTRCLSLLKLVFTSLTLWQDELVFEHFRPG
jgi:Reeler domain